MSKYKLTKGERVARHIKQRGKPKRARLTPVEAQREHRLGLIRLRRDERDDRDGAE